MHVNDGNMHGWQLNVQNGYRIYNVLAGMTHYHYIYQHNYNTNKPQNRSFLVFFLYYIEMTLKVHPMCICIVLPHSVSTGWKARDDVVELSILQRKKQQIIPSTYQMACVCVSCGHMTCNRFEILIKTFHLSLGTIVVQCVKLVGLVMCAAWRSKLNVMFPNVRIRDNVRVGDNYRIKPEELYILSCRKGSGRRPWPFPQLRM